MGLNMEQLEPQVEAMAAYHAEHLAGGKERQIPLATIRPSRWQPRQTFDADELWELAKSIEENGLINAIVVFPATGPDGELVHELVAGERRTRACLGLAIGEASERSTPKRAVELLADVGIEGLRRTRVGMQDDPLQLLDGATIRAQVERAPQTDEDLARLHRVAIVENLERANLNPLEEAHGLQGLVEAYGWSQRDLARHLGKSQGWVAQRLALLELPEAAQAAVSTRVLSLTHARALQGLPEDVAPAVTDAVVKRVEKGATTRTIEGMVGHVKDFLDVERYTPAEDGAERHQVIMPKRRNKLALLRWAIEETDWQAKAGELLRLEDQGYLTGGADQMLEHWRLRRFLKAAGYESQDEAWRAFAAETLRFCANCAFDAYEWEGQEWADDIWQPACRRMKDPDAATCMRYIGKGLCPEVVELPWPVKNGLDKLGISYPDQPSEHVIGVDAFVELYGRWLAAEEEWAAEEAEEEQTQHIEEIRAFYEWQLERSMEAIEHVRAHVCNKCVHHAAELHKIGHPPCRLVEEPLRVGNRARAPQFGVLVTKDGRMLPRCEAFAYKRRPTVKRVEGTRLPKHGQVLGWIRALASRGVERRRTLKSAGVYRVLQWYTEYGNLNRHAGARGMNSADVDELCSKLRREWGQAGKEMDDVLPTLLDVVASEAWPEVEGGGERVELVNPTTGERERFVPVSWGIVTGTRTWPFYKSYPEGWPRPWEDALEPGSGTSQTGEEASDG